MRCSVVEEKRIAEIDVAWRGDIDADVPTDCCWILIGVLDDCREIVFEVAHVNADSDNFPVYWKELFPDLTADLCKTVCPSLQVVPVSGLFQNRSTLWSFLTHKTGYSILLETKLICNRGAVYTIAQLCQIRK